MLLGATLTLACRSTSSPPAAVSTPVPASMPSASTPALPSATGDPDADLVLDHRGAFGPVAYQALEVFLEEQRAVCRRVVHGEEKPQMATLSITAADRDALRADADGVADSPPRSVRRPAMVHDLGRVSLSVRTGDAARTLLIDGAVTLDPYPETLLRALAQLRERCAYSQSGEEPSSAATGDDR